MIRVYEVETKGPTNESTFQMCHYIPRLQLQNEIFFMAHLILLSISNWTVLSNWMRKISVLRDGFPSYFHGVMRPYIIFRSCFHSKRFWGSSGNSFCIIILFLKCYLYYIQLRVDCNRYTLHFLSKFQMTV